MNYESNPKEILKSIGALQSFIWKCFRLTRCPNSGKIRSGVMVADRILPLIRTVFARYLEAQWTVALHILRFWSTHQYYRTVEYEPNRTIGDGDTLAFVISLFESYTVGNCQYNGWRSANLIAKIVFVIYLRHQWSDSVHILRFDSTDEYFKTVEYEEQRSTELRDIERKPCGSAEIFRPQPSPQTLFFQILSFVWAEITFIWNFVMVGSTSKSL